MTSSPARRFWRASFRYRAGRVAVSYEDLRPAIIDIDSDPSIVAAWKDSVISIRMKVRDQEERRDEWFSTSVARGIQRATFYWLDRLADWAERYGRDARGEEFSRVREISIWVADA